MAGFGGSVKLTGESEYRRALKQCTQSLREMSTELKAVSSSYDKNDSSASTLEAKQKQLTSILERQKSALATLKGQYEKMSSEYATQTAKHDSLVKSYNDEKAKLDQIGQTLGTTSKEYQDQKKVVDDLAQEVKKSTTAQDANEKSMSNMRIAINNAEAACNNTAKELDNLGNAAQEAGEDAKKGSDGFTVMKGVLANLATDAVRMALDGLKQLGAAVVDVGKQAVDSYANYEQLVGGVETLFGAGGQSIEEYANSLGKSVDDVRGEYSNLMSAQDTVLKNAANAYQTAGLSANDYMETVTGLSASLIQGLGGDTAAAAEYADMAITDMSDNANKMGTSMSSIQDAYAGFAKGNYTMLDNLKLGYGGTQSEMIRLINDSGILNEEISSLDGITFDQVVSAIHEVQDNVGITGTTAKEASETIEGSKNAMLGAYQNMLTGMADENQKVGPLFQSLVDSIVTYMGNLLPRITETLSGMTEAVQHAVSELFPKIQQMMQANLPNLVREGTELIVALIQGLVQGLPLLVEAVMSASSTLISTIGTLLPNFVTAVVQVVPQIVDALMQNLPTLISGAVNLLMGIVTAIPKVVPAILEAVPQIIDSLITGLTNGMEALINGALALLNAIVNAIPMIIPAITEALPTIIDTLVNGLVTALPQLLEGGIKLLNGIVQAIPKIIPPLVAAMPQIITTIITTLTSNIPLIVDAGIQLLTALVQNMPAILAGVGQAIPTIVTSIFDALVTGIPQIAEAGLQLIQGLWDGIKNAGGWLLDQVSGFASNLVDGFCSFFGINSPSTVMRDRVGKNLAEGVGKGFSDEMGNVSDQMSREGADTVDKLSQGMGKGQPQVMQQATQLANAIMQTFTKAKGNFTKVGKTVSTSIANGLKSGMSQIRSMAATIVKQIVSAFNSANGSFTTVGRTLATSINNGIRSGQSAIVATAKAIANAVVTAFRSSASGMRSAGSNMASNLNSGIKSGQSAIVSSAKAIATAVASAFTSSLSSLRSAGSKLAAEVNAGLDSGKSSISRTAGSIASSAYNAISGYVSSFKSMGKQLADGLKNGFLAQEASVRTSVVNMVNRIVRAAKNSQKIASPSKVWAEMGGFMAQGLDVGFVNEMRNVTRDIQNSIPTGFGTNQGLQTAYNQETNSDKMVSAFKEALSQMKIELDDDEVGRFVDRTVTRLVYA